MTDLKYQPFSHDHTSLLKKALKRKEFRKAYGELEEEPPLKGARGPQSGISRRALLAGATATALTTMMGTPFNPDQRGVAHGLVQI